MSLKVRPQFIGENQMYLPAKSLNQFAVAEVLSDFAAYQNRYGVYDAMRFTKQRTFKTTEITSIPMSWQAYDTNTWNPVGNIDTNSKEVTPSRHKINMEQTREEIFFSAFEHLANYDAGSPMQLDSDGERLFNEMVGLIARNALEEARRKLSSAGLYDSDTIGFDDDTPNWIEDNWATLYEDFNGYLKVLQDRADSGYGHLDIDNLIPAGDVDADQGLYTGDVLALFEDLRKAAPKKLRQVINRGLRPNDRNPIVMCSAPVFDAVVDKWRSDAELTAQNRMRVTREEIDGVFVYFIDGIPVYPADETSWYDQWLKCDTYFMAISVAGNIQLGSSFAEIPDIGQDAGVLIERSPRVTDFGKIYVLANSLFGVEIADEELTVATQAAHQPS